MRFVGVFKLFAVFLLLSVLLTSCYRPGTLGATGYDEAYVIANNAVPFFIDLGADSDTFDLVKLLDTDEYGRTLYEYCCGCSYSDATRVSDEKYYVSLLIVCQSYSKDGDKSVTVSWYDNCWAAALYSKYDYFDFDESTILSLKNENDWGKPLDNSKMNHTTYIRKRTLAKEQIDAKNHDVTAIQNALRLRYGDGAYYGARIRKGGMLYTLAYLADKSVYFVCCDRDSETIVREQKYEGDILACRDEFNAFMHGGE